MSVTAVRFAGGLAALLGCAAGCAIAPRLEPVTITTGCYVVSVDSWPTALVAQTGLTSLPGFVSLDTAVAGPLGRRVRLPVGWDRAQGHGRPAYWTELLHGNRPASLILRFRGPGADFVASLEASDEGYAGTGAAQGPDGGEFAQRVEISLAAITCSNVRLEGPEEIP
jgi:hypothetical protein